MAANITDSPDPLTVTAPDSATFECTASGLPRPNITWFNPNSTSLTPGMDGVTITDTDMGDRDIVSTLTLSATAPSDSGTYTCSAGNNVVGRGDINSVGVTLTIYGRLL